MMDTHPTVIIDYWFVLEKRKTNDFPHTFGAEKTGQKTCSPISFGV